MVLALLLAGCGDPLPVTSSRMAVIRAGYSQQLHANARLEIPPGQRLFPMSIRGRQEWCSTTPLIIPMPFSTGRPKPACFWEDGHSGRFRQAFIVAPLNINGAWAVDVPYVVEEARQAGRGDGT